jgi:GNAT superfamily N-acetyltransferase
MSEARKIATTSARTIRLATLADVGPLAKEIERSNRILGARFYSPEELEMVHAVFRVDTQLIQDSTYFVVVSGEAIIGGGGWSYRKKLFGGDTTQGLPEPLDPATDPARLRAFFVAPEYSGRGVADDILHACEEAARRAGFRRIELAATKPGVPFYRKHGYQDTGNLDHRLADGRVLPLTQMMKGL